MLYERILKAKRSLGIEEKLIIDKENEQQTVENEEVILGQDYLEDNTEEPVLGKGELKKDPICPNNLDADSTAYMSEDSKEINTLVEKEFNDGLLCKEDPLCNVHILNEDTSGNTKSNVMDFLEKYSDGNDCIQILRKDLMSIISDIQWIKESGNENEQFSLDFVDALNTLSVSI